MRLSTLRKQSSISGDNHYKETTNADISLWSAVEDTDRTEHTIPKDRGFVYAYANQLYRQMKKHGSIECEFCDDQRSWSQAVKIAASREPTVKISAAKPQRKSWLAAIFMTVGLPIHSKH